MRKKLFVTDLDGTALGGGFLPYSRFPDQFSAFLDRLSKAGWSWAINTTWDPKGQADLVKISRLESRPMFLMGEFGRSLAVLKDGEPVPVEPYTSEREKEMRQFIARKMGPLLTAVSRFAPARCNFYGHLFQYKLLNPADEPALKETISEYMRDPELLCRCENASVQARPAFLGKGLILREVCRLGGFAPEDVVVAGDEPTDLDMMNPAFAAHCICPANAAESVKERVRSLGGSVGTLPFGAGVVQAFEDLENWGILR